MSPFSTPSYTSSKCELHQTPDKGNYGLYAREPIAKDEVLCVWGGRITDRAGLAEVPDDIIQLVIQVEEDLYLVPLRAGDPSDYINHSCNPNCGLRGQITLVSMRDIQPGEEICFDYAMSDSSDYDEFDCSCGASNCRGHVSGEDWKIPELQERYKGYFMPYLQVRIDRMRGK